MNEYLEEIKKIIEEITDIPADEIEADSQIMDDLDLSSIEIMSVIAEIERKYSVHFSEEELMSVQSVADIINVVDSKRK